MESIDAAIAREDGECRKFVRSAFRRRLGELGVPKQAAY
jgi:hypothetical protein